MDEFVHNLEAMVLSPAAGTVPDGSTGTKANAGAKGGAEPNAGAKGGAEPNAGRKGGAEPNAGTKAKTKARSAAVSSDGSGHEAEVAGEPAAAPSTVRQIQSAPAEPVNLVGVAGPSLARRLLPFASVAGALVLLRVIVYALRRRRS